MRVTKATRFRTSTSTASHTTIVVLDILDPLRISIVFLSEYLREPGSIPHSDECRRLERMGKPNARLVDRLFAARRIGLAFDLEVKSPSFAACLRRGID